MKRMLAAALAVIFLVACQQKPTDIPTLLGQGKWIDLSYSFSNETLYWPSDSTRFHLDTVFTGTTAGGYYYSSNSYRAGEHGGTHLDAPVHFAAGKLTADAIPIDQLTGAAVVIDVSAKAATNKDYEISVADVEDWEKQHGQIPDGAIVLFRTGFGKFYPDAEKYLGTAEKGQSGIAKLHFPGIAPSLSEWLVKNRKIKAVGIDTASVDFGQSKEFKTHQILYAQNICGFENVANLDQLPETGAYVVALPMKIKDGSGGPLRIVAWVK